MDSERWHRLDEILQLVLEREGAERAAFLDSACGGDSELLSEIESLIADDDLLTDFMEKPPFASEGGSSRPPVRRDPWLGRRLGPWEILEEIGRGGMSTVYLAARRDREYESRVAIKIVRSLPGIDPAMDRFRQERQILANLSHPSIARLLDGGTTEEGLPYFVMECIEGVPVDRYLDERRATVAERLELFCKICEAVQVAHQNLVVHRDIKPGNILIAADGGPKLLDFGIAKLLEPEGFPQAIEATRSGLRPMTPGYASPEQIRGEAITTASDVYSLGVLLYRLLTGRSPYRVPSGSPSQIEKAILEQEPVRPSSAVREHRATGDDRGGLATPEVISRKRRTPLPRLRRQLAGDLDTIVQTALRKDPRGRYRSVEALAGDIQRHLRGLPVTARRETFGYLTAKYLRRHWLTAGVMLLLAALGATSIYQAVRIAGQRDRIAIEKDRAEGALAFLVDLFEVSDPRRHRGDPVTAREVLDEGAVRIERTLAERPGVQITLLEAIADVYTQLGLYPQAGRLLSKSLALKSRQLGLGHPGVGETLIHLAVTFDRQSRPRTAERLLRQGLLVLRASPEPPQLALAEGQTELGFLLGKEGRYEEAEVLHREALAIRRRELGDGHSDVAATLLGLCVLDDQRHRLEEAEESCRRALSICRRELGDDHPDTVLALGQLAAVLRQQGQLEEAERLTREALAVHRRLFADEAHPDVAFTLNRLAGVLRDRGALEEAERYLREGLLMRIELLGEDHMAVAVSRYNLATLLQMQGDLEGSEQILEQVLAGYRRHRSPSFPGLAYPLLAQARNRLGWGDAAAAEPLIRQAVALRLGAFPRHDGLVLEAENLLARCLISLGRDEESEEILLENLRIVESPEAAQAKGRERRRQTFGLLAELYQARGQLERGAEYARLALEP